MVKKTDLPHQGGSGGCRRGAGPGAAAAAVAAQARAPLRGVLRLKRVGAPPWKAVPFETVVKKCDGA